ncbi:hypothetical protein [Botrimarina hoheduenensis]|uniref:Ferritin-like domain protein n=1 Tax=Botrimarina hoheduenensis TaxID=2528000 RepID=A0A5C5WEL9_9BACT|nr:hypothetical protein [Botrimarina hoheduenensis]TWT48519.1 hypothetical protein Pla111_02900 [Botrimarina hoheduenensis]
MPNRITLHALRSAHGVLGQSLLQYFGFAKPYTAGTLREDRLMAVLERESTEERASLADLTILIEQLGGAPDAIEFPMRHTACHDVSVEYALRRAATDQKAVAARIELLREELVFAREADTLLSEVARDCEARANRLILAVAPPKPTALPTGTAS